MVTQHCNECSTALFYRSEKDAGYFRSFFLIFLLLALTAVVLAKSPAYAADAKKEPVRVVYGFDREFPPFTYEDPGGEPVGFEIELVRAIFHGTNASLVFRPMQWERIGLELSAGTISLTSGMVRTQQRSQLYLFSDKPSFPLQIRLFTKIYNRFPALSLFRGQKVGVEQGSYQHRLLESYGGINIKTYPGRVDGLRALYLDEIAAYCAPVQNAYYYINKLNYGAITTVGTPLGITEMRIAVNRNRGDILRMVNEGLARVKASGEYDRLYRKWFVRELGAEEQEALTKVAKEASISAYVPYGKKGSGVALLTATGKVYSACAVENAASALSLSAMQGAVAKAVADGEFELRAAVTVDQEGNILSPTAGDLQTLYEFGPGILLLTGKETHMVSELLRTPVIKDVGLIQIE